MKKKIKQKTIYYIRNLQFYIHSKYASTLILN